MPTFFKLLDVSGKFLDVGLKAFQQSLPQEMHIESRDDGTYLSVDSTDSEDETAQFRINRELDRLYFLTGVQVRAEMCKRTVSATLTDRWSIFGSLPPNIKPLAWSYPLALQLRLWATAGQLEDPLIRILLLFQIIELYYGKDDYPAYDDLKAPPEPRTECKLLRNLIAHSGDVHDRRLQKYCSYLDLPPLMLDRTDPCYVALLSSKAPFVEREAKKVIQSTLESCVAGGSCA
ncbi:hypothetical protein [Azonexus sp.]|jgi:hypothetical protein|uniref:hypothetical protein n=1 Tax=Azonexus sp. TaxID=1872668 RepID=UPI00281BFFDC|nr:hypothetical protein [Azonexus sp.]MDR1994898.1 hypothetical protein [Azonexus sp.]